MKTILEKLNETATHALMGRNLSDVGLPDVFIKDIVKDNLNGRSVKRFVSINTKYPFYNDEAKPGTDFEIDDSGITKYTLALCEFPKSNEVKYVAIEKAKVDKLLGRAIFRNKLYDLVDASIRQYGKREVYDAIKDMESALKTSEWESIFSTN